MTLRLMMGMALACATVLAMPATAAVINGSFVATVDQSTIDSANLFGLGSSVDVNGQTVRGNFSYDIAALSAVTVTPQGTGQTDYGWTNNTGAVSLTITAGATTTTIRSTVSGGVLRADRPNQGFELIEVYANDGVNHAEQWIVSPQQFLGSAGTTIPDYVFTLPNVSFGLIGDSYLTVGSETVRMADTAVSTSEVPEPASTTLLGLGLLATGLMRRWRCNR